MSRRSTKQRRAARRRRDALRPLTAHEAMRLRTEHLDRMSAEITRITFDLIRETWRTLCAERAR